jgi:hypothetical protein
MPRKKMTKTKSKQTRRGCTAQEESDLYAVFDDEQDQWGDSVGKGGGTHNNLTKQRTEWKQLLQRADIEEGYAPR